MYLVTQSCPIICKTMDCSLPGSSVHGDSTGKNTRMGCHALLQEIFPTQGSNPGLPHCRQILYHLSHQGCPRILEWIACRFSRESSWPRNWTRVSCTAGRFFTSWATREAHSICQCFLFPSTCCREHCQPLKTCLLPISPASSPPELLLKIHALATLNTWGSLNGNAIFCKPFSSLRLSFLWKHSLTACSRAEVPFLPIPWLPGHTLATASTAWIVIVY